MVKTLSRKLSILFTGIFLVFAGQMAGAMDVTVTLKAKVANPTATEVVSFGVPFGPGSFTDLSKITVWNGATELPIYAESLVPWRGTFTGIRSVLVQFVMDFSTQKVRTVTVRTGTARTNSLTTKTPIVNTLFGTDSVPRIFALMPAAYLCSSWVAGPVTPMAKNTGAYKDYESYFGGGFIGWTNIGTEGGPACCDLHGDSTDGSTPEGWLFDRVTTLYRGYVRLGADNVLRKAAYAPHSNNWRSDSVTSDSLFHAAYKYAGMYRRNIWDSTYCGNTLYCRGLFKLKNPRPKDPSQIYNFDTKYSYTECFAIHYMLTGDARYLTAIRDVASCWFDGGSFSIEYRIGRAWTERHFGFGWLAYIHAWEMLGRTSDSTNMVRWANATYNIVNNNPDGWPADGAWRHIANDGQEWGYFADGSSVWMSSILEDALFRYWLDTGDDRMVKLAADYSDWANGNGIGTESYAITDTCPWYWASSKNLIGLPFHYPGGNNEPDTNVLISPSSDDNAPLTTHNMEAQYCLSMGHWFAGQNKTYMTPRIRQMWNKGLQERRCYPLRLYNWCLRNTSYFMMFMDPASPTPAQLRGTGTGIEEPGTAAIRADGLQFEARPNPFKTLVSFQVYTSGKEPVSEISIFNVSGKLIKKIKTGDNQPVAMYSWNAKGMPSGLYFARIRVSGKSITRQLLLLP